MCAGTDGHTADCAAVEADASCPEHGVEVTVPGAAAALGLHGCAVLACCLTCSAGDCGNFDGLLAADLEPAAHGMAVKCLAKVTGSHSADSGRAFGPAVKTDVHTQQHAVLQRGAASSLLAGVTPPMLAMCPNVLPELASHFAAVAERHLQAQACHRWWCSFCTMLTCL